MLNVKVYKVVCKGVCKSVQGVCKGVQPTLGQGGIPCIITTTKYRII